MRAPARTVDSRDGIRLRPVGCVARLADGAHRGASRSRAEAFEEDCRRAAWSCSARTAPPDCAATVIDRNVWRERGALALRRTGMGFAVSVARPAGEERPWSPGGAGVNRSVTGTGNVPAQSPDMTLTDEADSGD